MAVARWVSDLGPTNPIILRIVANGSRRPRHLWIRSGFLALLMAALLFGMVGQAGSLRDLAQRGATAFTALSFAEVALICIMTPLFMAGAIAQEANPRTWEILLSTPLNRVQIVLGNLFGRLFFVLALLVGALIDAHEAEGLHLPSYYGPGSTASIVLKEHGEQRAAYPAMMQEAVLSAYFRRYTGSHSYLLALTKATQPDASGRRSRTNRRKASILSATGGNNLRRLALSSLNLTTKRALNGRVTPSHSASSDWGGTVSQSRAIL